MADILIIDDDQVLSKMLVDQMKSVGHFAEEANTLEEGLEKVNGHGCDVVFLDVQLPDGNGLEYLSRFNNMPSLPEVIIITGQGEADGAEKAVLSGAWSYIEKPHVIRELPLHLARALQYRPVGSSNHRYSDFRLVAATNRDHNDCVAKNQFRDDLLFRLQATTIELPPLKERVEDIRELAMYFITTLCQRYGLETKGVAPDFIEALMGYDWPGNVRELYQTMEQVFTASFLGPTCFAIHLPEKFRIQQARAGFESQRVVAEPSLNLPSWREYKAMCEKSYVQKLKLMTEGNVSKGCRLSGLSRTRLYQLLQKYNVTFS